MYNLFSFQIVSSTTCTKCERRSQSQSLQIYEEMEVPQDQSTAKEHIEQFFNGYTIVENNCSDGCRVKGQGTRRTTLKSCRESKFIIIIFSRAIESEYGYQIAQNIVKSTDPILLR